VPGPRSGPCYRFWSSASSSDARCSSSQFASPHQPSPNRRHSRFPVWPGPDRHRRMRNSGRFSLAPLLLCSAPKCQISAGSCPIGRRPRPVADPANPYDTAVENDAHHPSHADDADSAGGTADAGVPAVPHGDAPIRTELSVRCQDS
jgi:hypothetical protein